MNSVCGLLSKACIPLVVIFFGIVYFQSSESSPHTSALNELEVVELVSSGDLNQVNSTFQGASFLEAPSSRGTYMKPLNHKDDNYINTKSGSVTSFHESFNKTKNEKLNSKAIEAKIESVRERFPNHIERIDNLVSKYDISNLDEEMYHEVMQMNEEDFEQLLDNYHSNEPRDTSLGSSAVSTNEVENPYENLAHSASTLLEQINANRSSEAENHPNNPYRNF
jgi:hypothetical protein